MSINIACFHSALNKELELTQNYITTFSDSKDKLTNKAIKHIVNNKGKMLRPILLILAGKYSYFATNEKKQNEKHFIDDITKAAAILELVQMSSLVHDDVLDSSSIRRNKSTLNTLKGNRFAILMGDYLVAQSLMNCYDLIIKTEREFDSIVMYSFLENISKLVLGEIQQNNFNEIQQNGNNCIEKYFEIVENKTASLFSLACFVGSTIGSNNSDYSSLLKQFGQNIGIAYQIIDDLRDFASTPDISGEKKFQDIKYGIKTLPIIFATKFSHNGEMEKLTSFFNSKKDFSKKDKFEIINILKKTGSVDKSLQEAKSYLSNADTILNQLPENKYSTLLSKFVLYLNDSCDMVVDDILNI